jgi:predicted nucleic acid-binding Zn ribbon protein
MKLETCRDCGASVPAGARGCPQCARNLEAERMLARYFWLAGVPVLLLLLGLVVLLLAYRR